MKKLCLLTLFQVTLLSVFAQKIDSVKLRHITAATPGTDKREFNGFTIRILPANINGFGFDILNDNKNGSFHHFQNPLPFSPGGIQKKEDAYKVAQWIITEYNRTGHWQNTVPPHIAKKLDIEWN